MTAIQEQISELFKNETIDFGEKLSALCTLLNQSLPHYTWVGFYFADHLSKTLHLGPYSGAETEHTSIPFGKGICGQVAVSEEAQRTNLDNLQTSRNEAPDQKGAENQERRVAEPVRAQPKVGRNEPCPCGSGKKYKACHGKAD